jgi:hypothetical protein
MQTSHRSVQAVWVAIALACCVAPSCALYTALNEEAPEPEPTEMGMMNPDMSDMNVMTPDVFSSATLCLANCDADNQCVWLSEGRIGCWEVDRVHTSCVASQLTGTTLAPARISVSQGIDRALVTVQGSPSEPQNTSLGVMRFDLSAIGPLTDDSRQGSLGATELFNAMPTSLADATLLAGVVNGRLAMVELNRAATGLERRDFPLRRMQLVEVAPGDEDMGMGDAPDMGDALDMGDMEEMGSAQDMGTGMTVMQLAPITACRDDVERPIFARTYSSGTLLAAVYCERTESGEEWVLGGFRISGTGDAFDEEMRLVLRDNNPMVKFDPRSVSFQLGGGSSNGNVSIVRAGASSGTFISTEYLFPRGLGALPTFSRQANLPSTVLCSPLISAAIESPLTWFARGQGAMLQPFVGAAGIDGGYLVAHPSANQLIGERCIRPESMQPRFSLVDAVFAPDPLGVSGLLLELRSASGVASLVLDVINLGVQAAPIVLLKSSQAYRLLRGLAVRPVSDGFVVFGQRNKAVGLDAGDQIFMMRTDASGLPRCRE